MVEHLVLAKDHRLFIAETGFIQSFKRASGDTHRVDEFRQRVAKRRDFEQASCRAEGTTPSVRRCVRVQIRNDDCATGSENACSLLCKFSEVLYVRQEKGNQDAIGSTVGEGCR